MKKWWKFTAFPIIQDEQMEAHEIQSLRDDFEISSELNEHFKQVETDTLSLMTLKLYTVWAIIAENTIFLQKVLSEQSRKNIIRSLIDDFIECAIDSQSHECYMMLTDYKYKNNLFQLKDLKL